MCCEYGLQPQLLVLPLSPKSTFCIAARLTTSPPCLKSFGDTLFFTEQNLEPLTSIQSPWASGPAISHRSWLYLDTPAAPKSAWFQLSLSCSVSSCAKSFQLCLTLYNPMDRSPPGSSVHGILLARILEWVSMPSSRGSSQLRDKNHISYI